MKTRYIISAMLLTLAFNSCQKEAIAPLEGNYQKPQYFELNSIKEQSVEKTERTRRFNVELASAEASLKLCLLGNKYFLEDAAYTPAAEADAKNGNYISELSSFTAEGKSSSISSGSISVKAGEGTYCFSGTIWLEDKRIVKFNSTVELSYLPDPEPVILTQLISAASNVPNGTKSVSLSLASEGVIATFNPAIFQFEYSGSGNYLTLDIYSEDGFLSPGVYKASAAGGSIAEGEFGIGWDPGDLFGWGIIFENWGTCWWTVDGNTSSAEKITSGEVKVDKKGSIYTIEYNSNGIFTKFEGKIEALDPDGGNAVAYDTVNKVISATSNLSNGTNSVSLVIASDGVEATYNAATWSWVYSGEGHYLALDIYSADGKLAEGDYQACSAGGSIAEGEFGIGWDPGDLFGWGIIFENWGTCWWTVEGESTSAEKICDGSVHVGRDGDNYIIELQSTTVNVKYVGPIEL
ncbi:MAG: hypothetical protein ACI3ZK_03655 [Candidatus Cryptobacteroides sp.]